MSRDDPHFRLRVPEELKAKVEAAANKKRRSMTAEIVDRLEETFRQDEWLPTGQGYADLIAVLEEEIAEHEELQQKYDRQYNIEYFDAFKDEILEAIREKKKK